MNYKRTEAMFKAFCDESRLKILELLKDGERCGCNLLEEMHIKQSTLSHHMKILCDSGVLQIRKAGKRTYYSISDNGLKEVKEILDYYSDHSYEVVKAKSCENEEEAGG